MDVPKSASPISILGGNIVFKLKFSKTYDFAIMIENNLNHVIEDAFIANDNVFCVADGVTRERLDRKVFSYPETLEEALDLIKNYPNPSGASIAANLCVDSFTDFISKQDNISKDILKYAVQLCNKKIAKLNYHRKIDYTQNDYFACVACGGIIKDNTLYCFGIGDTQIRVLDSDYNTIFSTKPTTQALSLKKYKTPFWFDALYHQKSNWNSEKFRGYYRRNVRNNVLFRILKKHTFGALTGEKRAMFFVNTYEVPLENAKYILAHSDGCDDCLLNKEQIKSVIENPEQIRLEKHEKTLIIYEKE